MQEEALKNDEVFFLDLSLRLKAEGNKHLPEGGGHLPVYFGGNEICAVLPNGDLTIKKAAASPPGGSCGFFADRAPVHCGLAGTTQAKKIICRECLSVSIVCG